MKTIDVHDSHFEKKTLDFGLQSYYFILISHKIWKL
jgi:hypothetical protein